MLSFSVCLCLLSLLILFPTALFFSIALGLLSDNKLTLAKGIVEHFIFEISTWRTLVLV